MGPLPGGGGGDDHVLVLVGLQGSLAGRTAGVVWSHFVGGGLCGEEGVARDGSEEGMEGWSYCSLFPLVESLLKGFTLQRPWGVGFAMARSTVGVRFDGSLYRGHSCARDQARLL